MNRDDPTYWCSDHDTPRYCCGCHQVTFAGAAVTLPPLDPGPVAFWRTEDDGSITIRTVDAWIVLSRGADVPAGLRRRVTEHGAYLRELST